MGLHLRLARLKLHQIKVKQLHKEVGAPSLDQHHVLRLEVAVDQVQLVRCAHGVGEGEANLKDLIEGEWGAIEAMAEGFTAQKFHHREG